MSKLLKIQIGAGADGLPGFLNFDIRKNAAVDIVGHAGNLKALGPNSVRIMFAHAVFEHVYIGQHVAVLKEWSRVLSPDGWIVCLAIPDFSAVAKYYLGGGPGCLGARFDLFEAYRQTHGEPEHATPPVWGHWDPAASLNSAPPGWIPQLHKSLFDPNYVRHLLEGSNLSGILFNYAYPGEIPRVSLGFVACKRRSVAVSEEESNTILSKIPNVSRYLNPVEISYEQGKAFPEQMALCALRMESESSISYRFVARVRRRVSRLLQRTVAPLKIASKT